jgi:quercetin dioxygenase-like cupin family protein
MIGKPVVVQEAERPWETWPEAEIPLRGRVEWKTLISGDVTSSDSLTLGLSRLAPGESLNEHRHEQAEIYLVLAGSGVVGIDGEERTIGPGSAVFIPGNASHSCRNTGTAELRAAYVLAADSFEDVRYVFAP